MSIEAYLLSYAAIWVQWGENRMQWKLYNGDRKRF